MLEDQNQAAAEAIRLSSERVELCVNENILKEKEELKMKYFTEDNLQKLVSQCKQTNNWSLFRNSIEFIFSNRLNLSTSFLQKEFSENLSMKTESSLTASATPKSKHSSFSSLLI